MSSFNVKEMKRGRVDDDHAFYTKLQWFACLCFGSHINFNTKAGLCKAV